jgi:nitrite reductase/ring-hydroxylating ferredoxin subunit
MKKFSSLLFLFVFMSCIETTKTNIPDSYVNIQINLLNNVAFMNGINSYIIYDSSSPTVSGFGYGGVLLYHSVDESNPYVAFDLCCPYEVNKSIKVTPNSPQIGTAKCPKCGSTFSLAIGDGQVVTGPAKYGLRNYKVVVTGETLQVTGP